MKHIPKEHTPPKFTKNKIKYFGKDLCRKFRDYEAGWNIDLVETIDELDKADKLPQILYDSIGVIAGSEDMYTQIQNATDEIKRNAIIGFIFRRASIWRYKEVGTCSICEGDGDRDRSDEDSD